jgi:hypothetical protein
MKNCFKAFMGTVLLALWLGAGTAAHAYPIEMKFLTADEITKFSDQELTDAYMAVLVEVEAQKSFHATSGFRPNDYDQYKGLLLYQLRLVTELKKRKLSIPSFSESY